MSIETNLSYFLINFGAIAFSLAALSEFSKKGSGSSEKCSLLALSLLILGLCAGILASPSDRDPLYILNEFFGVNVGSMVSVRFITLFLAAIITGYLALKTYGNGHSRWVKTLAGLGVFIALVDLIYIVVRFCCDLNWDVPILVIYVVAFTAGSAVCAYALYELVRLVYNPSKRDAALATSPFMLAQGLQIAQSTLTLLLSLWYCTSHELAFSTSAVYVTLCLIICIVVLTLTLWQIVRRATSQQPKSRKGSRVTPIILMLISSLGAMLALLIIGQLISWR